METQVTKANSSCSYHKKSPRMKLQVIIRNQTSQRFNWAKVSKRIEIKLTLIMVKPFSKIYLMTKLRVRLRRCYKRINPKRELWPQRKTQIISSQALEIVARWLLKTIRLKTLTFCNRAKKTTPWDPNIITPPKELRASSRGSQSTPWQVVWIYQRLIRPTTPRILIGHANLPSKGRNLPRCRKTFSLSNHNLVFRHHSP